MCCSRKILWRQPKWGKASVQSESTKAQIYSLDKSDVNGIKKTGSSNADEPAVIPNSAINKS